MNILSSKNSFHYNRTPCIVCNALKQPVESEILLEHRSTISVFSLPEP